MPRSHARTSRPDVASRARSAPPAGDSSPSRPGPWTVVRWLLLAVCLGYGIVARVRYFDWCMHDDAYISFRYARNLVRGAGLVMNPGERVEGITNLLWTLFMAPAIAAGLDPSHFAQIVGAVLGLGLMAAAFVFTEKRLGGGWYSLVTPAALAFNIAFVLESLSGLETLAFAVLVFAAWVAFLEERRGGKARGVWAAWCAAAAIVRPEGALVFAVFASYAALGSLRGEPVAPLRRAVIVFALLLLPLFAWRLAYYGDLLPNTFYAKVGHTEAQLARGWRFVVHSMTYSLTRWLLGFAALATAVALVRPVRVAGVPPPRENWTRLLAGRPRDEALAVAAWLALVYVAYVMVVGGDYEPTARFYLPVLIPIYLLFQEGLRTLVAQAARASRPVRGLVLALTVAGAALCLMRSETNFLRLLQARGWPQVRRTQHEMMRTAGEWLRANTPPQTVLAFASIGALPYYADRPVIDLMGLTDRHIARVAIPDMGMGPAGHEKGDGEYVLSRRPDIILFDKGLFFPTAQDRATVQAQAHGVSELQMLVATEFTRGYDLRTAPTPIGVLHYFALRK